ncbi:MAG: hypothetical protein K8F27_01350 [Sulfuricellaceae bacterium]|nr:hypothetical protein [Sulfuricellaceae bacterium]
MFSIKDIEVLEKFAGKLYVPLFAAACLIQPPFSLPEWLSGASVILSAVSLVAWVVICLFALWGFHDVISYADAFWFRGLLFPVLGFVFVSFGALVLCKFAGPDPFASLSPFWNLGALTYGLLLLQITEPKR